MGIVEENLQFNGPLTQEMISDELFIVKSVKKPPKTLKATDLLPIRQHIARIYRSIGLISDPRSPPSAVKDQWKQVDYNLFVAQSIDYVCTDTGFFDKNSANYCNGWGLYDGLMSAMANKHMLASLRFNLIWTAFECLIKTQESNFPTKNDPKQTGGGARKQKNIDLCRALMKNLDGEFEIPTMLLNSRESAIKTCTIIGDMQQAVEDLDRKSAILGGRETFSYCSELVRIFRNHVAHGDEHIAEPDNTAIHRQTLSSSQKAVIDRHSHMSRVLLILMQTAMARQIEDTAIVRAGYEYVEFDEIHMPFREFLAKAHLAGCGGGIALNYDDGPFFP